MRLFRLEVKRIIKSRHTVALLVIAFLMSIVMAYLPISFEAINHPGENGEVIELDGIPAIRFKKITMRKQQATLLRKSWRKTCGHINPM